jgi:hypothetical protein
VRPSQCAPLSTAALIALALLACACVSAPPPETSGGATSASAGQTLKWPLGMEPTFRP